MPGARGGARFIPEIGPERPPIVIPRPVYRPAPSIVPKVAKDLPPREYQTLSRSYVLALERVADRPACRELFDSLGAEGAKLLEKTYYLRAKQEDAETCTNGVVAFTRLHDYRCWICPRFGGLSVDAGAMILIHEALHMAGLPEDTAPNGEQSSFGINRIVHNKCFIK